MDSLKNLFIPSEANNYKARLLHPEFLIFQLLIFLGFQLFLNFFLLVKPSVLGFASSVVPQQIVELTNQKRAENGFSPLKLNSALSEAASRKAGDMFAFNYWAHTSPSGRDPWSFFREAGYQYLYAGENLARDFNDSGSVVNAWMASPTHKDNILNSRYQEIGVAVVNGALRGVETTLVVQLFGTPKAVTAQKPRKQIEEKAVAVRGIEVVPEEAPAAAPEQVAVLAPELSLAPSSESLSSQSPPQAPLLSPLKIIKICGLVSLGFLVGLFMLELSFLRRRVVRLAGRNLAHVAFLGMIILLILLTGQGVIL
jgi:hypothetical protein